MLEAVWQLRRPWLALPVAAAVGAMVGLSLFHVPLRDFLAGMLVLAAALAVFIAPTVTMGGILVWLTLQALIRRLLIPVAGWSSNDPLLLVAPTVLLLYCSVHHAFRQPMNRPTRLMVALLGVVLVEAVSPAGAGLRANVVGALFVVVPVLWYFAGRMLHPRLAETVLLALPWAALPLMGYGLWQMFFGLPPWDQAWVQSVGYSALHLGNTIRSFGTFGSSAEYEIVLLMAAVTGFGLAFRSRGAKALLYLAVGLADWVGAFLDGSRTGIVFSVAAIGVLWAYRLPRQRMLRLTVTGAATLIGYLALIHGHHFQPPAVAAGSTATATVFTHQMQGLTRPLTSKASTLSIHLRMMRSGLLTGLRHPLGEGLGAISLAGTRFGSGSINSEFDVTNMFIAGGIAGGVIYLCVWLTVLVSALTPPRHIGLARYMLPAILLVAFGQWLNGGYYLASALVWLLIGSTLGRPVTPDGPQHPHV